MNGTPLKTFRLTIYRQDGSAYWVEHANTREALEHWLAEEQMRPYWDPSYTHVIEEM